ncbi:MAG: polysaccharide export protein [Gammaproteobacteria bacterium]|nr:polysaccharide export protein [Gammaproteobacteria bacterium]
MILNKFALLIWLLTLTIACSTQPYFEPGSNILSEQNASQTVKQYYIGVDDTIMVTVWKNPDLSIEVPVRPDGKITVPLIGDVQAAGLSPERVAVSIKDRLKNFIRDPNVTVIVTELLSHEYLTRLRVTGAVNNPMSLNYRQGMTILDAVLAAGSVNDFAAPNKTKLYRKVSGKIMVMDVYLGDILNKGELETNVELRPGDIITVPERLF